MNAQQTVLANACFEALDSHDERAKHSVFKNTYACPRCGKASLISEVLEVNEALHRYEVEVKCSHVCGATMTLNV